MSHNSLRSRRSFIRFGAGAAAAYGLTNLAPIVRASSSSLNRTTVCLYLLGGNDSNNMIVPLDSPAYDWYAKGRGALAIPRNALLNVYSANVSAAFGFHPSLAGVQDLYNQGVLGVVANVGRAAGAVNRAAIKSNPALLPADLYQHAPASQVRYLPNGYMTLTWAQGAESAAGPNQRLSILDENVTLASSEAMPAPQTPGAPSRQLRSRVPQTPTGRVLGTVLNALRGGGEGQEFFLCPVSGFDTHRSQLERQAALFSELNDALVGFYDSLQEMGIADRVTLFTQTEFNRTLAPNTSGGSEHGWGGHQLVLGRSVLGGQVHGRFPSLELGGPDDAGTTGIWIPSATDVQYAATIATWLGRNDLSTLPEFAGLRESSESDLGFLAR